LTVIGGRDELADVPAGEFKDLVTAVGGGEVVGDHEDPPRAGLLQHPTSRSASGGGVGGEDVAG